MRVRVNDQDIDVSDGATIADLLVVLQLPGTRVAIEVNRRLVRRAEHATARLAADDRIEVVTLVGGG